MKCTETRGPWKNFPPVFIFSPLGTAQNHECYEKAKKESDHYSALRLVKDIVNDIKLEELRKKVNFAKPLVVPVQAEEEFGVNRIPAAFAYYVATRLGFEPCDDILMVNKPMRTGKSAFYRLVHYPIFTGNVLPGQQYIIADDTLVMGGTLTSLRGFIENNGGTVIQAIALTGHPGAALLNIKDNMLKAIYDKHGEELNEWWKTEIGFGIDKLTQGEAGHIKKAPNADEIRNRIAQSRS
ncbi:Phosphoribosyltransferase [Candidatus Electrothrix aarhusensis]